MKLKSLLKETKVWERKFGESLPTLEDTTKAYKLKLEQEFKAKSKETGRVVVYKSKDSMDKAIKGGTAEPLDKKTSDKPKKVKGADIFKKDKPKSEPKKVSDKTDTNVKVYGDDGEEVTISPKDQKIINKHKTGQITDEELKNAGYSEFRGTYFTKFNVPKPKNVTKIKDGKIKSSSSKQFAKDVRKMKGEYDLDGGVKIKDGKMFNADGEEMDSDDIADFYYQDAYEPGNDGARNVGIDIKQKESEWSEEDEEGYITNLKTGEREYVRENKMKLKSLLKEAQVWERKFGEPLPTFSSVMEKHSGKKIDEQGVLSRRAGINVFGDKKLELIAKSLINTAKDLHHTAKRKDEKNFDDVLSRITISLGVIRSYLNKPKRSM